MCGELYKPYLVLRMVSRELLSEGRASVFRSFRADRVEVGVRTALVQACTEAKMARWGIAPVGVSDDIVVYYLGPEYLLESAVAFINTQLIDESSKRSRAESPLKDTTHLKHSYLCRDQGCRHAVGGYVPHYCAWWCIDVDHQFALFKTQDSARLFLYTLLMTDLSKIGPEDLLRGES